MKIERMKFTYSVYCWDGWQRGHFGDFDRKGEALDVAQREARTGTPGDVYYVERKPGQVLIDEYHSG